MPFLLLSLTSFLSACDSGSNELSTAGTESTAATNDKESTSSSNIMYDREITKRACDLLTADAVAIVAGVEPAAVTQSNIASFCIYSWAEGNASLGHMRASKKIKFARTSFENSYRSQTGEELAEQMVEVNAQIKKQQGDTSVAADPKQVEAVTGALSGALSGGMQFEDIKGVGDMARFETTRMETQFGGKTFVSYPNTLNILTGNLKFTVSFNLDGEAKLYRDENVALAEAVLEKLSGL